MNFLQGIIGLGLRFYAGWSFLSSGLSKWRSGFDETAVTGYLQGALSKTSAALLAAKGPAAAAHPDVTNTWAWVINNIFLPNAGFFAFLIKLGEVAVGLALIIGLFTHLAAGLGSVMCFIFLLSGSASITGPLLLCFLIIFWLGSESYLLGVDRFFMRKLVKDHPTLHSDILHPFFPAISYKRIPEKYQDK